jgi:hypothetical protein
VTRQPASLSAHVGVLHQHTREGIVDPDFFSFFGPVVRHGLRTSLTTDILQQKMISLFARSL